MHYYTSLGNCAGFKGSASTFMTEPSSRCGSHLPARFEDFDVLLNAVTHRLRQAATTETVTLADVVQECADALEQLQRMLTETREQRPVQVLREQNTGAIVTCWASQHLRGGFARTTSTGETA